MSDLFEFDDDDEIAFGDTGDEPDLGEAEAALAAVADSHDWSDDHFGGSVEFQEGMEGAEAALAEIAAESEFDGDEDALMGDASMGDVDAEFAFADVGDGFGDDGGGLGDLLDVLRANPGLKLTLSF
ncbi:MAG: hypothetical protein HKN44_09155 [Ilumatobacter sp.]|nr:hypothetical protein [Ilumatobacter sp.]